MPKGKGPIDLSNPSEIIGGGGSFFNDGLYRVEQACYTDFDYGKGAGNATLCTSMTLQALDAKGADQGEPVVRYWGLNATMPDGTVLIEGITPIKGRKGQFAQIQFTEDNTHDRIWAESDFGYFLAAAQKNEVDMDAIGNDITNFEGNVYEFGKVIKKAKSKTAVEEAENGKGDSAPKRPSEVIVIVGMGSKPAKGGGGSKDKAKDNGKAESKGNGKSKEKTPQSYVEAYIAENVTVEENESGTPWIGHRVDLSRYLKNELKLDAETVKATMKVYNSEDEIGAILSASGWELEDGEIKKSE